MKSALILALPAMALAAATPPTIEERDLPGLPGLPSLPKPGDLLDVQCLLRIADIRECFPDLQSGAAPPTVGDLRACFNRLTIIPFSLLAAIGCVQVPVTA